MIRVCCTYCRGVTELELEQTLLYLLSGDYWVGIEADFIVPSVRRLLSWNWSRLYSTFCQETIELELEQTLLYFLCGIRGLEVGPTMLFFVFRGSEADGGRLKTSEGRGQASLRWFIEQSNRDSEVSKSQVLTCLFSLGTSLGDS